MKLKVPLIRQKEGSNTCGIVGIQMVMQYYGDNISFEELKSELEVDSVGTYAPQLGSSLIRRGYGIEIVTLHPSLFTLRDKEKNLESLVYHFTKLKENSLDDQNKKVLNYFIDFIKIGGKLKIKIPDEEDIKKEIYNKHPLGALLTSNFLFGKEPRFNFHFNVITGIDNKYVYVNDSRWDELGGEHKYKIKDFLFGMYASAYGDLDNASIMKIKKFIKR